jgi:hypothetical protein
MSTKFTTQYLSSSYTQTKNPYYKNITYQDSSIPSSGTLDYLPSDAKYDIFDYTLNSINKTPGITTSNETTPYSNNSLSKNECEIYISGLTENIDSEKSKIKMQKKHLDCFNEPGNCFTLSTGKKICIPSGFSINSLNDKNTSAPISNFKNYNENFVEANSDSVNVDIAIDMTGVKNDDGVQDKKKLMTSIFPATSFIPSTAYSLNNNNITPSRGIRGKMEIINDDDSNNQLASVSSNDAKIIFPDAPNAPDNYSYNGALQSKGSDYVPMNSMSEKNKMLGRLDYKPPPLPPNMDFSYFGALRNKGGEDAKPVNALQGPNNYSDKILDENLYSISGKTGMQEFPIPNRIDYTMARPEINKNNPMNNGSQPIDLYSQYGALVPKDNFYAK